MFLDENTPDLRTIRRRYSELGIADLLNDDGDIIMQPPQLVQDFPEEIRLRLIIPAGGEDDETLVHLGEWTPVSPNTAGLANGLGNGRRRLQRARRTAEQQPQQPYILSADDELAMLNTARNVDDDVDDGDDVDDDVDNFDDVDNVEDGGAGGNNGQELVIDEGVVALEPEHYAAGDLYDDYDGDYDYDDVDEEDRYSIDTFDLYDYGFHPVGDTEDSVFFRFYPPDGDVSGNGSDDAYVDEDDGLVYGGDDEDGGDNIGADGEDGGDNIGADGNTSPPWLYSGGSQVDENEQLTVGESEEDWESNESAAAAAVLPPNTDHDGLTLQQDQEQAGTAVTTRSASGGADWPVSELGQDSDRTIRLWTSYGLPPADSGSDSDW